MDVQYSHKSFLNTRPRIASLWIHYNYNINITSINHFYRFIQNTHENNAGKLRVENLW